MAMIDEIRENVKYWRDGNLIGVAAGNVIQQVETLLAYHDIVEHHIFGDDDGDLARFERLHEIRKTLGDK